MKSKATTYMLIALVLIIWGMIAWKLFVPPRTEIYQIATSSPRTIIHENSDTLMLDYPDPFLKKNKDANIQERTNTLSRTPVSNLQPLEIIREDCLIRYIGYIRKGKNLSCIVESGDAHHSIIMGEIVDGFRLTGIYPDSLVFKKDGLSYTITLL